VDETADAYRLAYDEAVRTLSQQEGVMEAFRTRAGVLLSAAAVTTSFLGAQALHTRYAGLAIWLALACFAGLSGSVLAMLLPSRAEFAANPKRVIAAYIETDRPLSMTEIHRDLAFHMEASHADNNLLLKRLAAAFRLACGLMAAEVALWIVALASTV
jgi:hypothetical protein